MDLDCESKSSTLRSVADCYGVATEQIDQFLRSIDLDAHYEKFDPGDTADVVLASLFVEKFGDPIARPDRICWFHLTRTLPGKSAYSTKNFSS